MYGQNFKVIESNNYLWNYQTLLSELPMFLQLNHQLILVTSSHVSYWPTLFDQKSSFHNHRNLVLKVNVSLLENSTGRIVSLMQSISTSV